MKKSILLFIIISSISCAYSQDAWQKIFEKKDIANIGTIITKESNEILFILSGDKYSVLSTDFGNSWTTYFITPDGGNIDYSSITIYDDMLVLKKRDTLIYSTDFGRNWNSVEGEDTLGVISSMFLKDSTTLFLSSTTKGIFKYDFVTNNYNQLNNNYPLLEAHWVFVNQDDYLFCQTKDKKMFYSRNDGITWINRGNPGVLVNDQMELNETTLIISSANDLFKSTNTGGTWQRIGQDFEHDEIYYLQKNENKIYCWCSNGIFISYDEGENWEFLTETIENSRVSISKDDVIFYSTRYYGIYYSTDLGVNWNRIIPETEARLPFTAVSYHSDYGLFAATLHRGLYKLKDEQATYLGFEGHDRKINRILFDNDENIFINFGLIYFSNDTGTSWQLRSPIDINHVHYYVGVSELKLINDGEALLVGTGFGTIFKSYDKGQTWVLLHETYPVKALSLVDDEFLLAALHYSYYYTYYGLFKTYDYIHWYKVLDEAIKSILQINNSTFLAELSEWSTHKLFRSTDYAETWEDVNFNKPVNCYYYKNNSDIYIGSDDGIYVSTDLGLTWDILNMTGLENKKIYSLTFDDAGDIIAAAADGVYKTTLQISTHTEDNISNNYTFQLSQNYPNPFNPTTKIKFEIPAVETGHAPSLQTELRVFDLLGREVAILINKPMSAGTYEVEFDGSNLPSGVYFYKLTAGNFTDTKKLLLLK